MSPKRAVILLSGGLDSATVLYLAREQGYQCYALSFDYRQRHQRELAAAKTLTAALGVTHQILQLDFPWGGSALTDPSLAVPQRQPIDQIGESIPITYVPARNTIFLSYALAYAEVLAAQQVWLGANVLDYSGYPDCRPDYIQAMGEVYRLGTRQGRTGAPITLEAPLVEMSKAEIIQLGNRLGVPWQDTWSCYQGLVVACGVCDACQLRSGAFASLGLADPLPYQAGN